MKKIFLLLLTFVLAAACLGAVACGKSFTVTFDGNGGTLVRGSESQTVTNVSEIEEPVYERAGYEFIGWDTAISEIKNDATVKALWKKIFYKVTFDGDGGTLVSGEEIQEVSFLSEIVEPVYQKNGYDFKGWDKNLEEIKQTATVKAVWEPKEFVLVFVLSENERLSSSVRVKYGSKVENLPKPEKDGYVFVGWVISGQKDTYLNEGQEWRFLEDVVVFAEFRQNGYSISYDFGGASSYSGELITFYPANSTEVIDLSSIVLVRTGYKFEGWSIEGETGKVTKIKNLTKSIKLIANWTEIVYHLTFMTEPRYENNSARSVIINGGRTDFWVKYGTTLGSTVDLPTAKAKDEEEYKFNGWCFYVGDKKINLTANFVFNEETLAGLEGTEIKVYPVMQKLWIGPY